MTSIPPESPADNPQARWYYSNENGQVVGPLSFAELEKFAVAGVVASKTYVFEEGATEWLRFSEITAARSLREPASLPAHPEMESPATSDKPEPRWLLWLTKFIEILAIIVAGIIRGCSSLLRSFANATAGTPSGQLPSTPQARLQAAPIPLVPPSPNTDLPRIAGGIAALEQQKPLKPVERALMGGGGCLAIPFAILMIVLGAGLCCTILGALIGVPMILGGLAMINAGGIGMHRSVKGNPKLLIAPCPYCGHPDISVKVAELGINCPACLCRIVVRNRTFCKVE